MKINRASYQMFDETISIYISFNEFEEEDIIVRFIGGKKGNPNNLEEYLNNPIEEEFSYYKTFIKIIPTIKTNYIIEPEQITKEKINKATIMLEKISNDFFMKIPIIKSISPFPIDPYTDFEDAEVEIYVDGGITTTGDLIAYIVNKLQEKNIEIVQETWENYEDENQLCRRI